MIDCCPVCGLSRALHYNPGDTAFEDHAYEEFHPDRALDEMRGIRLLSESHGKLPEDKDVEKFMNLAGALDAWLSERGSLPVSWARVIDKDNWTGGLTNGSPKFLELTADVERLILDSAYALIKGDTKKVARDILSRLAHVMREEQVPITYESIIEIYKIGEEWHWTVKVVRIATGDSIAFDRGQALQFGLACEQAKSAYDRSLA